MSVADNMAFAPKVAGVGKEDRMTRMAEAAKLLALTAYLDRKPDELWTDLTERRLIVEDTRRETVTRHGAIIRLRPEKEAEYLRLHRDVWPEVLAQIARSNIRNFTIFLRDGLLFSYFEYIGSAFDADMQAMAEDPQTRAWWKLTDPCQERLPGSDPQWSPMAEVFHVD